MGNASASVIVKKYDGVPKEHTASAGHLLNWKIWPGVCKDSNTSLGTQQGDKVSVWSFDKNDVMKRKNSPITDKTILEQLFQIMKKDFTVIKEAVACQQIIQLIEVIEDSKSAVVFTTERVVCSLADLLRAFDHIAGGAAVHFDFFNSAYGPLSEIEISRGLRNITEGLQYLHTVQRKLHLNLCPESIVITASGQWKLCGFGFSLAFIQGDLQRLASPYFLKEVSGSIPRLEPDLRYCGPETTDGGTNPPGVRYLSPLTDSFALGIIMMEVYKFCASPGSVHRPFINLAGEYSVANHPRALESVRSINTVLSSTSYLPAPVSKILIGMVQPNTNVRFTTADVINSTYFAMDLQAVLNTVDNLPSKDIGTQSSSLISLLNQLDDIPARILTLSVLPTVNKICLTNSALWVYALPLHESIFSLRIPREVYQEIAGRAIAAGLAVNTVTETMQAFLVHVYFICDMFDHTYFQNNVVTLFCNAIEKHNAFLQNLAIERLSDETIRERFSKASFCDKLIPKLCKEACKNPEASVKIQALYILSLLSAHMNEEYVATNILPSLKYITDNEKNASVSMCVVGSYEAISDTLGCDYIAKSILPSVEELLVDKTLSRQQFEVVVNLVKSLLKKVLDVRTRDLGIAEVGVGELVGSSTGGDPFSTAKSIIASTRHQNSVNKASATASGGGAGYSSQKRGSVGCGAAPPPPPSKPPPPPPSSGPPPPPSSGPPSLPHTLSVPSSSTTALYSSTRDMGIGTSLQSSMSQPTEISSYQSEWQKTETYSAPTAPAPVPAAIVPPISAATAGDKPAVVEEAAKSSSKGSVLSWFSKSSSSSSSATAAGGMAAAVDYQPPVVPTMSSSSLPIDEDDFLSSFKKSPAVAAPVTASYSAPAPAPVAPRPSTSSTVSIEEQIRQTQEKIAKLSHQPQPQSQQSFAFPSRPSDSYSGTQNLPPSMSAAAAGSAFIGNNFPAPSYPQQSQPIGGMYPSQQLPQQPQTMGSMYPSQQQPQQPYYPQQSQPQYQQQPQYMQQHQPQYQQHQVPQPFQSQQLYGAPPQQQFPSSQLGQPASYNYNPSSTPTMATQPQQQPPASSWSAFGSSPKPAQPDLNSRIGNMPQPKPGASLYQPPPLAAATPMSYMNPQQPGAGYMCNNTNMMATMGQPQQQQQQQQQQQYPGMMGMKSNNNSSASSAFDFLN